MNKTTMFNNSQFRRRLLPNNKRRNNKKRNPKSRSRTSMILDSQQLRTIRMNSEVPEADVVDSEDLAAAEEDTTEAAKAKKALVLLKVKKATEVDVVVEVAGVAVVENSEVEEVVNTEEEEGENTEEEVKAEEEAKEEAAVEEVAEVVEKKATPLVLKSLLKVQSSRPLITKPEIILARLKNMRETSSTPSTNTIENNQLTDQEVEAEVSLPKTVTERVIGARLKMI